MRRRGLSLACACDIRIAADDASFVPGFVGIGLVPDAGGTYFLNRLLGASRAFEWMSSNRRLTAAEAHAWGLVSEVVEGGRAAGASGGARRVLRGAADARDRDDEAAVRPRRQRDARGAARARGATPGAATETEDFREGVAAFLEKRAAAVQRPLTKLRADRMPSAVGGTAALIPASCACEAAVVTAGKSRRCAASPRPRSAFATRRSAASHRVHRGRVARRRPKRLEPAERGLVERQCLPHVRDDLGVGTRANVRLRCVGVRGADRVRPLDVVGVRRGGRRRSPRRARGASATQQLEHLPVLREAVCRLLGEDEDSVVQNVELARASRPDRRLRIHVA